MIFYSAIVKKFIENALEGQPLILEGGGGGMLDFTHIDDLIEGIVRSLPIEGGLNRTFNLTHGNARSIAELAGIIQDLIPHVRLEQAPPAPRKTKRGTLVMDRARNYLGFNPSRPIEVGYRDFCQWYIDKWRNID